MSGRWRILLLVSLALNVFILGAAATLIGGHFLHRGVPFMRGFAAGGLPPPPALIQALPDESRARIRGVLADERKEARDLFRQVRAARRATMNAFFAEPYSASDMANTLAASRELDLKAVTAVHQATARILSALTNEERQALAAKLKPCFPTVRRSAPVPDYCHAMRGPRAFTKRVDEGDAGSPPPPPAGEVPPPSP